MTESRPIREEHIRTLKQQLLCSSPVETPSEFLLWQKEEESFQSVNRVNRGSETDRGSEIRDRERAQTPPLPDPPVWLWPDSQKLWWVEAGGVSWLWCFCASLWFFCLNQISEFKASVAFSSGAVRSWMKRLNAVASLSFSSDDDSCCCCWSWCSSGELEPSLLCQRLSDKRMIVRWPWSDNNNNRNRNRNIKRGDDHTNRNKKESLSSSCSCCCCVFGESVFSFETLHFLSYTLFFHGLISILLSCFLFLLLLSCLLYFCVFPFFNDVFVAVKTHFDFGFSVFFVNFSGFSFVSFL